ncbi:MAG: hypothetical protein ACFFBP_20165 [Promethearchaeota archaeon]
MPLNPISQRFIKIEQKPNEILREELIKILKIRYQNENPFKNISWGTWIPSTNKVMVDIAKLFLKSEKIKIINPKMFCKFYANIKNKNKSKSYLYRKYKEIEFNNILSELLENSNGIILDDLYHHGNTFARIMELLLPYKISKILGITIVRTSGQKRIELKYFPK